MAEEQPTFWHLILLVMTVTIALAAVYIAVCLVRF